MHFTCNARSAIYQFLRRLPSGLGELVLLPSFHCPTVVEPVIRAGLGVDFYRIRQDLSIDQEDLNRKLSSRVAAVLVIHFCGFPAPLGTVLQRRAEHDYLVIEDWAHSFLTDVLAPAERSRGDLAVYSFSKLVPCLVGGGLQLRNQALKFSPANRSLGLRETAVIAKRLAEQLVNNSAPPPLKRAFQYGERQRLALKSRIAGRGLAEGRPYFPDGDSFDERLAESGMPWISRAVLKASNLERVYESRRRNYRILLKKLGDTREFTCLRPELPDGVCPWGFPLLLSDRSRFDHRLKERGVPLFTFGETLHPLLQQADPLVRREAEQLSRNMMLLSVHQNLSAEDMNGIAEQVNEFFKGD
jgi:dTDP-4-amino-4,6-dideoxygalactose transaminase